MQALEQLPAQLRGGPGVPVPQERASRTIFLLRSGSEGPLPAQALGLYLGRLQSPHPAAAAQTLWLVNLSLQLDSVPFCYYYFCLLLSGHLVTHKQLSTL